MAGFYILKGNTRLAMQIFLINNILWIVWAVSMQVWSVVVLQVCFVALNIRILRDSPGGVKGAWTMSELTEYLKGESVYYDAEWWNSDLFLLWGDHFNIEAVCPDYCAESQCSFTWKRDERGVAIISGYNPENDPDVHWMCHCGHYETGGGHCTNCGNDAPWGCDCGMHGHEEKLFFWI